MKCECTCVIRCDSLFFLSGHRCFSTFRQNKRLSTKVSNCLDNPYRSIATLCSDSSQQFTLEICSLFVYLLALFISSAMLNFKYRIVLHCSLEPIRRDLVRAAYYLTWLDLIGNKDITPEAIQRFREDNPNCKVYF